MTAVELNGGPDAGMTWHFGDPFAEQLAIESGTAAVCLTSREVFTVSGGQRLDWLHSLTSQQLAGLDAGEGADALVLSPTGQIEYGFGLADDGATAWCWTEAGQRAGLVAWLEQMKFWTPVEVRVREDARLWWLGRQLADPSQTLAVRPAPVWDGREVLLPAGATPGSYIEAGQWAAEAVRIAAGLPRIGLDTDPRTLPNELGLYATALDKGCYPGQETVARVHNLGRPPRRLVRLLFDGALPEPGSAILLSGKQVGVLGSTAQHHELGPIGLGLVKRSTAVDADLEVGGIAAAQEILVDPEVGEHFRPRL